MAVGYGVCIGPGNVYEKYANPSISRYRSPDDKLYEVRDARSWAEGYNRIAERAYHDGCESLILLHDDIELLDDPRERLSVMDDDVGLVGAIGGLVPTTLAWWVNSKDTRRGHIRDYRKTHAYSAGTYEVDVTDDPILLLPRWAIRELRLPPNRYVGFEALGVIMSFAVRARGRKVLVTDFDLMHHNPGIGLNDIRAWRRNELRWQRSFFQLSVPERILSLVEDVFVPTLPLRIAARKLVLRRKMSAVNLAVADSTDPVENWYLDRWKRVSARIEGRVVPNLKLVGDGVREGRLGGPLSERRGPNTPEGSD